MELPIGIAGGADPKPGATEVIELVCMHCHYSNLGDAKFCIDCGAGLVRRPCPSCHVVNELHAHFCLNCGARLPEAEPPLTQARAKVEATVIGDLPKAVVDTVESARPRAVVTAQSVSGMAVVPDAAPAGRASVLALPVSVGGAALLMLAAALWVFKGPAPAASVPALSHGASSAQAGADSINASPAQRPQSLAPVATQAALAAIAPAIGNAASAAVLSAGMAIAGQANALAPPPLSNTGSSGMPAAMRPPATLAARQSAASDPAAGSAVEPLTPLLAPPTAFEAERGNTATTAQRVAASREAARALPKPVSRERATAGPAGRPPPDISPRPAPAIACTSNVQALGLCTLTP